MIVSKNISRMDDIMYSSLPQPFLPTVLHISTLPLHNLVRILSEYSFLIGILWCGGTWECKCICICYNIMLAIHLFISDCEREAGIVYELTNYLRNNSYRLFKANSSHLLFWSLSRRRFHSCFLLLFIAVLVVIVRILKRLVGARYITKISYVPFGHGYVWCFVYDWALQDAYALKELATNTVLRRRECSKLRPALGHGWREAGDATLAGNFGGGHGMMRCDAPSVGSSQER